jgi:hypothetical protein
MRVFAKLAARGIGNGKADLIRKIAIQPKAIQ